MAWIAPTLKDYLQTLPEDERATFIVQRDDVGGNHTVRCRCGRYTSADIMLDIRALPLAMRQLLDVVKDDFVCDGCRETWFREYRVARRAVFAALGAPVAQLARIDAFARAAGEDKTRALYGGGKRTIIRPPESKEPLDEGTPEPIAPTLAEADDAELLDRIAAIRAVQRQHRPLTATAGNRSLRIDEVNERELLAELERRGIDVPQGKANADSGTEESAG